MSVQIDKHRIVALVERQYGVITRRQLLALGATPSMVETRLRRGTLVPLHPGIYAVGHRQLRREGHWLAAVLACGPGSVLSHRDAAALHGLRPGGRSRVDVTTARRVRSRGGIAIHHAVALDVRDVAVVERIPVTAVERTLVDLAHVVPRDALAKALREADHLRVVDLAALRGAMHRTRTRNGPGHAALAAVLEEHRRLGTQLTRSVLEDGFLKLCERHGLHGPAPTSTSPASRSTPAGRIAALRSSSTAGLATRTARPSSATARRATRWLGPAGSSCASHTTTSFAGRPRRPPRSPRCSWARSLRGDMDLDPWLPRAAALRPDHPALLDADGRATTYAELHHSALDAAAVLQAKGIEGGDRVALQLPPGRPFLAALHATLMLGATVVPIDLRLGPGERAARVAGAAAVVDAPLERAGEPDAHVLGRLTADAPATLVHTSGTTADPKPVALTIGNWSWHALGSAVALGLDPHDRWLCALPLSHVGGLAIVIRSAIYGTTVVLHERFATEAVLTAIERDRITLVSLVPTTVERLLDAGLKAPNPLRVALIGGGPLPPVLAAQAQEAGIPVAQTYGMTEACSQVSTSLPGQPETAGRPLVGMQVTIGADDEILVKGPTVAPAAADRNGWLHTGDRGRLDAHGRLTITGRKVDTIVSGGENVSPAEVETALLAHPAVADAGVHGRPDPQWGEAVVATVVLHDGAETEAEELRAHVGAQLARFKVPKEIAFADALPRTASGKLLRRELGQNPVS